MPSRLHDAFVQFFHMYPHCALRLAEALGLDLRAPPSQWRRVSGAFGDPSLTGKEFKADLVLAAFSSDGARALAVLILEPQLGFDPEKGISWLVYRAGVAGRYGTCPQWVLMVTPHPELPLLFRTRVYPDQPELWPIFVTAGSVSPVLEQDAADADPPWAALCVTLHARGPLAIPAAKIALQACAGLPVDQRRVILDIVGTGVRKKEMQDILEQLPKETQDEWGYTDYEREGWLYNMAVEKGEERGLEKGREEGLRLSLLRVLAARELHPTPEQRGEIEACTDTSRLERMIDLSVRAQSVAEVLAVT